MGGKKIMLYGKKGFINGVYIVQVSGYEKIRYFFYNAREAEEKYREDHNLKYKKIAWIKACY